MVNFTLWVCFFLTTVLENAGKTYWIIFVKSTNSLALLPSNSGVSNSAALECEPHVVPPLTSRMWWPRHYGISKCKSFREYTFCLALLLLDPLCSGKMEVVLGEPQAALWRGPCGAELRPPANRQHQLAVNVPSRKWTLWPQSSLERLGPWTTSSWTTWEQLTVPPLNSTEKIISHSVCRWFLYTVVDSLCQAEERKYKLLGGGKERSFSLAWVQVRFFWHHQSSYLKPQNTPLKNGEIPIYFAKLLLT